MKNRQITLPRTKHAKKRAFFYFLRKIQNDYKSMGRIITDDVFAALIVHLQKEESVRLFQKLLMSEKTADTTDAPEYDGAEIESVENAGGKK